MFSNEQVYLASFEVELLAFRRKVTEHKICVLRLSTTFD